jgi:hypothetical protein
MIIVSNGQSDTFQYDRTRITDVHHMISLGSTKGTSADNDWCVGKTWANIWYSSWYYNEGVYQWLNGASRVEKKETTPPVTQLQANTPNPFTATTSIRFDLAPGSHRVAARVFDITGRHIRDLADATLAGGSHRLKWDGRNSHGAILTNGVYILALKVDGKGYQQRMIMNR